MIGPRAIDGEIIKRSVALRTYIFRPPVVHGELRSTRLRTCMFEPPVVDGEVKKSRLNEELDKRLARLRSGSFELRLLTLSLTEARLSSKLACSELGWSDKSLAGGRPG